MSVVGAGQDQTVIEGTVRGLRTGAVLSDVTVTGGSAGGLVVASGEAPTIRDCTIIGNSGGGVYMLIIQACIMVVLITVLERRGRQANGTLKSER